MAAGTIRLEHASVLFKNGAGLADFTGEFNPGSVTALVGGDGAGKSTLLKVLAGRLRTTGGTSQGLPAPRPNVGYQPADSGVWRNLSVAENVEFVARTYGMSRQETQDRSRQLLELAGLADVGDRVAGRLSGGMRQKLGVVLATLHRPDLVLLDEPTTGVDPASRAELWSLISGAATEGATVVFATTYLDEGERADHLFLLHAGRLLSSGTPQEVIAATPGQVWQAPALSSPGRAVLSSASTSPKSWRRGNLAYYWDAGGLGGPEGFEPAPGDLENTSIALLLGEGDRATAPSAPKPAVSKADHASTAPLVEAKQVSQHYGDFAALSDVSLTVRPGEVVGLLGGNGAGKTTLMRILLGLEKPTGGTSTLFGGRPTLENRRRIGYVAQGLGLYPSLSPEENLEFAAAVQGVKVPEQTREFARTFGRRPVAELPLGTKRNLAYLAATVHRPQLLILDEPTSGMDALARSRLWRDLRGLADLGDGILITTHYMQEAAQCDRLLVLTDGRVTSEGTPQSQPEQGWRAAPAPREPR